MMVEVEESVQIKKGKRGVIHPPIICQKGIDMAPPNSQSVSHCNLFSFINEP